MVQLLSVSKTLRGVKEGLDTTDTGVKSAGCENRMAHLSPIHSWKSISPWVVRALKLGAVEPRRRLTDS